MKFLITTPFDPKRTPERYLTPDEIVGGPNFNKVVRDGRMQFIGMPTDICDAPHLLKAIPESQQPDLIVVHYDPAYKWSLDKIPEILPRILIVSGTHRGTRPIASTVEYILKNHFSAVFFWNKQHVHFFREAGFKNIFWLPGLLMSVPMRNVRSFTGTRENKIAFFGSTGPTHQRRSEYLKALSDAGLPLLSKQMTQADGLECFGKNLIAFNASMNDDFNMRVFEATSMGAMLLTDRLSLQAGLQNFYKEGESVVTYEGKEDLLEKARYYLAHPEEALAIGARGKAVYDTHFSVNARAATFLKLLRGVSPLPCYAMADDPRCHLRPAQTNADRSDLGHRVLVYEWLQEIHLYDESLSVDVISLSMPRLLADISDLKRLSIRIRQPLVAESAEIAKTMKSLNVSVQMDDSPLTGATLLVADSDALDRPEVVDLIAKRAYKGVFFGDITPENREAVAAKMGSLNMATNGSSQTFYYPRASDSPEAEMVVEYR